jgi:biotin synthase
MTKIAEIVQANKFSKEEIIYLLQTQGDEQNELFQFASETKQAQVGNKVYLRGLIELSNVCIKNCLYCGIRKDNDKQERYLLTTEEVVEAAKFAYDNNYGSVVLQSGELYTEKFIGYVEKLLHEIKKVSNGKLGITLSCGEQTAETYQRWFHAGAHRYLLRIESSNIDLYEKIHPKDALHSFETRINCLKLLQKIGYQVGTGVMIGLPFQTVEDLADDLLFLQKIDIDMCGMGPYLEHNDTPLFAYAGELLPLKDRFNLSLKMVAILRLMMKDINIAATTALQTIDAMGREKALKIAANIFMPNITPKKYRESYKLYENKPCTDENPADCANCIEARICLAGCEIAKDEWGDSQHFKNKQQ